MIVRIIQIIHHPRRLLTTLITRRIPLLLLILTTSYTDQDQLLTTTTNSTAESNGQESAQLPQTGNDEHAQSLLGLAGITMLGLLGYGFASKKKRQ
ncbi:LPXTG cell wall anchor domain-containing protein [Limosilactobacillus gastricus]|uniref:LPXTG cell wall anchor domain-containing protein n=1 Tax=Limosilactobacillus gastricus TaxID=227942 RepID=UPI0009E93C78|nr:LPXTG cell wall anchor domain-containing protein [Limosilactobacillus gastricus]